MLLSMIKEAVSESKYTTNQKHKIKQVETIIGKSLTKSIMESYQVTPDDYTKWLEVILGYAKDEGINIKNKSLFADIAGAVLENDPQPIDQDIQEAVVNTLWANFKAQQQHSKVEKVSRAKEEEEQLHYALNKMKGSREEEEKNGWKPGVVDAYAEYNNNDRVPITRPHPNPEIRRLEALQKQRRARLLKKRYEEEESGFGQLYKQSIGMENEEYTGTPDEFDPREGFNQSRGIENEEYDDSESFDPRGNDFPQGQENDDWDDLEAGKYDEFDDEDEWDGEEGGDFQDPRDTDLEDQDIIQKASQMRRGRDLEDFDSASDEGIDQDREIIRKSKFQPKAYYASESEEVSPYNSPFRKGELVNCKRDNKQYKIEVEDGPGSMVGIMDNGRIRMVPIKDLESIHTSEENEENITSKPSQKVSLLHDVLHGTNSTANLKKLQAEIENQGANAHAVHYGRSPKNPHEPGSIAYKSWQKGFESSAKEIWSPRVVVDTKAKPKPKKK